MLIDCDTCAGQGVHCHNCVIAVFLETPPDSQHPRFQLDSDEQIALVHLAEAGLVPPLRMIRGGAGADGAGHDSRGIA
ncbi:MAG TPA: hypothetical protein VGH43_17120 [Jatrophihabitans sp.]|jgi:hypothetical protein